MANKQQWLNPPTVIAMLTLIVMALTLIVAAIPEVASYFQRPEIVCSTNEVTTYAVPYHDNKPAPAAIQGRALAGGLIKVLKVVVLVKGERTAPEVVVKIPVSKADDCVNCLMSTSDAPSIGYLLGGRTEFRFHNLLPGDSVTFYLNLGNLNSDLSHRIEVSDGDGRPAEYDPYVPADYLASKIKGWICGLSLVVGVILLLSILRTRRAKQPAISADSPIPANTTERPLPSPADSTAQDQESQDRNVSDGRG